MISHGVPMSLPPVFASNGPPPGASPTLAQTAGRGDGEVLLADAGVLSAGAAALTAWQLAAVVTVLSAAVLRLAQSGSPAEQRMIRAQTLAQLGQLVREAPRRADPLLQEAVRAFDRGGDALRRLVDRLAGRGEAAVAPAGRRPGDGPARTPVTERGGTRGRLEDPQPPRPPGRPPAAFTTEQPSAEDARRLAALRTRFGELRRLAAAGTVLTPAQIEGGWGGTTLAALQREVRALGGRPGITAAQRAELAANASQAQGWVAGRYRLTLDKALAGLLESGSAEGHRVRAQAGVAQPYPLQTLQALHREGGLRLAGLADTQRLAMLSARIAQRQGASEQGVPAGGRGTVHGEEAARLEGDAARRRAEGIERARRRAYEERSQQLPGGADGKARAARALQAEGLDPALAGEVLRLGPANRLVGAPGQGVGIVGAAGAGGAGPAGSSPLGGPGRSEAVAPEAAGRAARVASLLERAGHPPHLTAALDGAGQPRVALRSEALVPDARAALDRLARRVGEAGTDRLLDAMLLGYRGEVGLSALILAWRAEPGAQQRLDGRLVLDLGSLVTNLPASDALHDLEHLVGFRSGPGRGVYLTTMAGERALEYVGGVRSENGYLAAAIAAQRAGRPLESAFEFANLLRQRLERHAAGLRDPRASMPDDIRAGMRSRAEFLDALARLEGLKLMLGRGGLDWGAIDLNDATTTRWDTVAQRFPAIERIDFAVEFPGAYAEMLEALTRLAEPPPTGGPLF